MALKGKPPAIDIVKLHAQWSFKEWNGFLTRCLNRLDLPALEKALYGIQRGMAEAADKKLADEKLKMFFIRVQRSLEITIRKVIRLKIPNPLDNPLNKKGWMEAQAEKRKRDREIRKHISKSSY